MSKICPWLPVLVLAICMLLKLAGVISISWWVVMAPLWVAVIVWLFTGILVMIYAELLRQERELSNKND